MITEWYRSRKYCYPTKENQIQKKDEKILKEFLENEKKIKSEKKTKAIAKAKKTPILYLKALYVINKEAKRQRDIKYRIAKTGYGTEAYRTTNRLFHHQVKTAKENAEYFYNLKIKALKKIIDIINPIKLEKHLVNDIDMLCIYFNKMFSFHIFMEESEILKKLGKMEIIETDTKITSLIACDKIKTNMSLKRAMQILG